MKQEILCEGCGGRSKRHYPTSEPYRGEYIEHIDGDALDDYRCDQCYAVIRKGDSCVARGQWTIQTSRTHEHMWWRNFIDNDVEVSG